MVLTAIRDYGLQLIALLPPGRAWAREEGTNMFNLMRGIGDTFSSVDGRAIQLLDELDPRSTNEAISDWERVLGLPDPCAELPSTLQERRAAVLEKLTGMGDSTPAGMVAMAERIGFTITIEEHDPVESRCGFSLCGASACGGGQWGHSFTVHAYATSLTSIAACGSAHCGDPIRTWDTGNILECAVNRAKPAHTIAIFAYDLV